MKGLIVYKGKYGATRQYAEWLAEELRVPVEPADTVTAARLSDYDVILIGTSVYIGKLKIAAWIKENQSLLENKKIIFFLVSATKPTEKEKLDAYARSGIPEIIRKRSKIFYLPGRVILDKLSWSDRFLLEIGARLSKASNGKKNKPIDFDNVKKEHLAEIIGVARETLASEKKTMLV
jgi:menaquinone-dependent protoporphyrinogen IX oxidase